MNPCLPLPVSVAAAIPNATATVADAVTSLNQADQVILWTGLAMTIGGAVYWVLRQRRDPLANRPVRTASLPPELLLLPVLAYFLVSAAVSPLVLRLSQGHADQAALLSAGNIGMISAAIVCLAIGASHFRGGLRGFLTGDTPIARHALLAGGLLIISFPLCFVALETTLWIVDLIQPGFLAPEHPVIDALRNPDEPSWAPLALWIGAVVVAPLAEECFFRGLVQTTIVVLSRRRWLAIGVTATAFGIAHATQPQVIPALAVLGVLLGVAYEWCGGLLAPFLLHMLFNLKTMTWEFYGAGGS